MHAANKECCGGAVAAHPFNRFSLPEKAHHGVRRKSPTHCERISYDIT